MYSESLSNKTLYIGFDPATLACAFVCNYISRRHSSVANIILPADIEKCKNKAHTFLVNENFKALAAT